MALPDRRERTPAAPRPGHTAPARSAALRFVLLIGVVSMFSDMTHEGARGVTGPFLGSLGAGGLVVALVAGTGELLGYALRFVFGCAADRTGRYWPITAVGYTVQMLAVPLLAVAGYWPVAAVLIVAERSGRAMRTPARDAMLAHATAELGRGRVYGVREALDAAGATAGPLIVAGVLALHGGYRVGFAVFAVPAALTLLVLAGAWRRYPDPAGLEVDEGVPDRRGTPRAFWICLAGMGLIAAAYTDYPLIAYHFGRAHVVATPWIPVLYAGAMASEAVAALVLGRSFDRWGLRTVVGATLLTACFPPLVFLGNAVPAVIGVVLWGLGAAVRESVVRAAVTGMVGPDRRASAFGLFDTGFGLCWFAGSLALGALYDRSVTDLVAFSVVLQLAAVPVLLAVRPMSGAGTGRR
ncbi:MFS transporter [Streptomyces sp. CoT10]|uniref:MFS transporter n=1 Tax=Streptomyces sp. CoT10 TaxID=2875762 RepID=UPI001CD60062|nr:MFS transporter [Streptomyces sp. CoT10]